jgi:DNA-binding NarL/FixJ family response regulator
VDKISIVIIDDHPVIRHGVTSVLKKQPDMHVVGESDTAATALPLIKKLKPDVAILDKGVEKYPALAKIETS